ncbi:hypothetical protein BH11PAT1_BH11PAT1_1910 [soil metagenome]
MNIFGVQHFLHINQNIAHITLLAVKLRYSGILSDDLEGLWYD